jgi:hypothetical protein
MELKFGSFKSFFSRVSRFDTGSGVSSLNRELFEKYSDPKYHEVFAKQIVDVLSDHFSVHIDEQLNLTFLEASF